MAGPQASASTTINPDTPKQAIDGRLWFFPENLNGWMPAKSTEASWWAVTLSGRRRIQSVEGYFLESGEFAAPKPLRLQYRSGDDWVDVPGQMASPKQVIGNGRNQITFPTIETDGPQCSCLQNLQERSSLWSSSKHSKVSIEATFPLLSNCVQVPFGVTAYTVAGHPN